MNYVWHMYHCKLNSNKSSLKIPSDWHNYHLLDGGAQLSFHYGFCNVIFFSCFPANVSLLSVIVRSFWCLRLIFYVSFLFVCLFVWQCDQAREGLVNNASQMDEYCSDKGFINWFETSAKEDINISEAAKYLVQKVYMENYFKAHLIS